MGITAALGDLHLAVVLISEVWSQALPEKQRLAAILEVRVQRRRRVRESEGGGRRRKEKVKERRGLGRGEG